MLKQQQQRPRQLRQPLLIMPLLFNAQHILHVVEEEEDGSLVDGGFETADVGTGLQQCFSNSEDDSLPVTNNVVLDQTVEESI